MNDLTVQRPQGVIPPACESGHHPEHDGLTCPQADAIINAERDAVLAALDRALAGLDRKPLRQVPDALRGPNWSHR